MIRSQTRRLSDQGWVPPAGTVVQMRAGTTAPALAAQHLPVVSQPFVRPAFQPTIQPTIQIGGSGTSGAISLPRVLPADDLFERTAWLYAFFRERLFRDDTARIAGALWPDATPPVGTQLLEVGCGPGLYTRRLAAQFPGLRTVGIDRSPQLLEIAEARAAQEAVGGCRFERGDALALDWPDASVDAVVTSRLFTVVDGARALAELFRVLRPGGRCFIAEPTPTLATVVPLLALRLAGWLAAPRTAHGDAPASQPDAPRAIARLAPSWPTMLLAPQFEALVRAPAWEWLRVSHEGGYHYAVCQKAG